MTVLHSANGSGKFESIFLEAFDISGITETGEMFCEIVQEAKKLAKEKYNIDVYYTVSDNASNMIKMSNVHGL